MTQTQLEALVQSVVDRTAVTTIGRHVDRITESIVEDILREHRAEYIALVQAAITRALANLSTPPEESR